MGIQLRLQARHLSLGSGCSLRGSRCLLGMVPEGGGALGGLALDARYVLAQLRIPIFQAIQTPLLRRQCCLTCTL